MDSVIFIDANIYLRFFESSSSEFKKLLGSLEELKEYIFITSQIEDEIQRNKLGIFVTSFVENSRLFSLRKIQLPEHLDKRTDSELKKWNEEVAKIYTSVKHQTTLLSDITEKLIERISNGSDEVSTTISKLSSTIKPATPTQLERARLRKEIGNPPGKRDDPLGDQLSFEQLLDEIHSKTEVWIISNDTDYLIEYNKKCYLNPLLSRDIKKVNPSIGIRCFKSLTEGLRKFNGATQIKSLPKEAELDKIAEEEKKLNLLQTQISGSSLGRSNHYGFSGSTGSTGNYIHAELMGLSGYTGSAGFTGYSGYTGTSGFSGSNDDNEEKK